MIRKKKNNGKIISDPFVDPNSFGNIALQKQYITPDDLQEALCKQEQRLPLGEILVSMGKLQPWQRDEILLEQQARKATRPDKKLAVEFQRQRNIIRAMASCITDVHTATSDFVSSVTELNGAAGCAEKK